VQPVRVRNGDIPTDGTEACHGVGQPAG
jgi:hypothetical protein